MAKTHRSAPPTEHIRMEIIAANLRYGSAAAPLRVRAYAQVVAKVLLSESTGTALKIEKIRQRCRELLLTGVPSRAAVQTALDFLVGQGLAEHTGNDRYCLRARAREEMTRQVAQQRDQVDQVITRHFPLDDVDPGLLRQWFELTGVRFFSAYGDKWVAATARGSHPSIAFRSIEAVATEAAGEVGLSDEAGLLAHQFREFLVSASPEDSMVLWHFGRAMFAARLMAADLAADPVSGRELQGATFLLDTNLLLEIALERPELKPSLDGLARALAALGVRLGFIDETREEYRRAVTWWRQQTLAYYDRYGYGLIMKAEDDHIQAALRAGCMMPEDFERFYDKLYSPPAALGDLPIPPLDDPETNATGQAGASDEELIQRVRDAWSEQRVRNKRMAAARHDAALTHVARSLRKAGEGTWVLSTDRTMQRLASQWAAGSEAPLWITLDTLLQVLAVEEEGSQLDATVFGPLLAQLIGNEVQACRFGYQIEDVRVLDELISGAEALPDHEVQVLARRIHAKRMNGVDRADPELQHDINHMYQRARHRLGMDLQNARDIAALNVRRAEEAEAEAQRLAERARAAEEEARQARIREVAREIEPRLVATAQSKLRRSLLIWTACLALVVAIAMVALDYGLAPASPDGKLALLALVGGWVLSVAAALFRKILPTYHAARDSAAANARALAEAEVDRERRS
jgi:hypothetical protein